MKKERGRYGSLRNKAKDFQRALAPAYALLKGNEPARAPEVAQRVLTALDILDQTDRR